MKYQRSTIFCCKDIEVRKSEFVAKIQFLLNMSMNLSVTRSRVSHGICRWIFINKHLQLRTCFRFLLIDFGLSSSPEVKIQEVQIKYVCNALNKFSDLSFNILRIFITVYQNCQSHLSIAV